MEIKIQNETINASDIKSINEVTDTKLSVEFKSGDIRSFVTEGLVSTLALKTKLESVMKQSESGISRG